MSSRSSHGSSSGTSYRTTHRHEWKKLVSVQPIKTLTCSLDETNKLWTSLTITNQSSDIIIFKVKTTRLQNYHVKPNADVVESGSSLKVVIQTQGDVETEGSITADKFLVQIGRITDPVKAKLVPLGLIGSPTRDPSMRTQLQLSQLKSVWDNFVNHRDVVEYKLRVDVAPGVNNYLQWKGLDPILSLSEQKEIENNQKLKKKVKSLASKIKTTRQHTSPDKALSQSQSPVRTSVFQQRRRSPARSQGNFLRGMSTSSRGQLLSGEIMQDISEKDSEDKDSILLNSSMDGQKKKVSKKESSRFEEMKESINKSELKEERKKAHRRLSSRSRSPILRSSRKDSSKLSQKEIGASSNYSDPRPQEASPPKVETLDVLIGDPPLNAQIGSGLLAQQDEIEEFNAYDHVGKSGKVTPQSEEKQSLIQEESKDPEQQPVFESFVADSPKKPSPKKDQNDLEKPSLELHPADALNHAVIEQAISPPKSEGGSSMPAPPKDLSPETMKRNKILMKIQQASDDLIGDILSRFKNRPDLQSPDKDEELPPTPQREAERQADEVSVHEHLSASSSSARTEDQDCSIAQDHQSISCLDNSKSSEEMSKRSSKQSQDLAEGPPGAEVQSALDVEDSQGSDTSQSQESRIDELKIGKEDLGQKKVAVYFDYSKSPEEKDEDPAAPKVEEPEPAKNLIYIKEEAQGQSAPLQLYAAPKQRKEKQRPSKPKVSQRIREEPISVGQGLGGGKAPSSDSSDVPVDRNEKIEMNIKSIQEQEMKLNLLRESTEVLNKFTSRGKSEIRQLQKDIQYYRAKVSELDVKMARIKDLDNSLKKEEETKALAVKLIAFSVVLVLVMWVQF